MKDREAWLAVLLLFSSVGPSFSQRTPSPSSATAEGSEHPLLQLVWSDEFNEEVVDEKKWTILDGDGCGSQLGCGWGTDQLDTSSPTNVGMYNGHLVITARHSNNTDDPWSSSSERGTSSGRVSTAGSADFVYGRVDVRAKMPLRGWGGLAGAWLVPSENIPRDGSPSCNRVDVMEVRDLEMSAVSAELHFGSIDKGCVSSATWPVDGGSCLAFPPALERELSDGFHVYSVDWEEGQFRWYLDGWHYCTKTSWPSEPDQFPSPFDKAFHVEIGLGVVGRDESLQTNEWHETPLPQEMIVDYVRIFQAPPGRWWISPHEFTTDATDVQGPWFLAAMDILAFAGCLVGPYMAVTGISRPRTNTMLLGMETGAFKAANAVYIVTGSAMAAFPVSVVIGLLTGWLAVRSPAMARANTVAGLAVPSLFLLIDVGMIADIGSRYVCWAIFFILTVTFGVLAFLPDNHSIPFTVATAASGGCVFKLGLGRLLHVPGEIFKLLDDPLGDTCSVSRTCRSLTWVSAGTFVCGLLSQFCLGPTSSPKRLSNFATGMSAETSDRLEGNGPTDSLFTTTPLTSPPEEGSVRRQKHVSDSGGRRRTSSSSSTPNSDNKGTYAKIRTLEDQPSEEGRDTAQGPHKTEHGPERGLPAVSSRWKPLLTGIKSIFRRVGSPSSSQESTNATHASAASLLDNPTPVPMPAANTVVSSNGDTIEIFIHSPTKPPPYKHSWVGRRRERRGGKEGATTAGRESSLAGDVRYKRLRSPLSVARGERTGHRHPSDLLRSPLPDAPRSSSVAGHAESTHKNDSEDGNSMFRERCHSSPPDHLNDHNGKHGRLAQAFSQKWGTWTNARRLNVRGEGESKERIQEQDGRQHEDGTREASPISENRDSADATAPGGRGARELDQETLTPIPYESHPSNHSVNRTPTTVTSARANVSRRRSLQQSVSSCSSVSVANISDPPSLYSGRLSPFEPTAYKMNIFHPAQTYGDGDCDGDNLVGALDLNDHSEILGEKPTPDGPATLPPLQISPNMTAGGDDDVDGDGGGDGDVGGGVGGNDDGDGGGYSFAVGRAASGAGRGGQRNSADGNAEDRGFAQVAHENVAPGLARVVAHDAGRRVTEHITHEREVAGLGSAVKGHKRSPNREDGSKRRTRSPQSKAGRTTSPRQKTSSGGNSSERSGRSVSPAPSSSVSPPHFSSKKLRQHTLPWAARDANWKGRAKAAGGTHYDMELAAPPAPMRVGKNRSSSSSGLTMVDSSTARGDASTDHPEVSPRGRGWSRRSAGVSLPKEAGL